MKRIPLGAAFMTVAAVLACAVPAFLLSATDLGVLASVVGAVGTTVTTWLAVQDRREARDRGRTTRTGTASGLPDSNKVAAQAKRVLAAVVDICSGRRTDLDQHEGQGRFVRRAIDQAIEALGPTESGQFRERLNSLGLDPSMLIGPLDGDERTASAWAAADPDGQLARTRDQFRQGLLQILASDETSWLEPNTRRFFREALKGGRRFSRQWAGILPVVNARLVRLPAPEPGTEAAQARERCRVPADREIIGRSDQLAEIEALIREHMTNSGSAIGLITGEQPGVGASAVAKKLARELGRPPLFPGGVLYFNMQLREANFQVLDDNLRALDNLQRMTAEDVAREVLTALDAKPGALPFAAYRAAMEANGVLLVLDDADDASHVASLAVRIPNCCVLVTSRRRKQEYADFFRTVGKLARPDSIALLLTYAGTRPSLGWSSIRPLCDELAEYCEDLPMALHLVGGQISTSHLEMSLGERLGWLKGQLEAESGRLPRLERRDRAISKAVTLSYALLDDFGRPLLRMCHAANKYTVTCWESAFCLGQAEEWPDFEDGLENFVDMSLARTTPEASGRRPLITYSLYNFIRWFAAYLRREEDSAEFVAEFTRRFVIYMQRCLAALSEGSAEADHVDSGVAHFPELLITAVQLAYANQWDDLGIPLGTAASKYLTSAGLEVKTATVEGQLADFYLRRDQQRPAARLLLRASGRLRRAGMLPEAPDNLLSAAMECGQRALDLARRYEQLGEFLPYAAFAVSLAAAELEEWERALAAGSTAATWLREPYREEADVPRDAVFYAVINLARIARNAGLLDRARKWAQEGVQLEGPARKMALARAELAQILALQNDHPDALTAYDNAISLFEEARDFADAAEAAGKAALISHGEEAIRQHYRSIALWQRAEPVDVRRLSIQRINLSAAVFTVDGSSGTADILDTAIKELTAFRDAPLLLLEAQVRRAGLSLLFDGQLRALSVDASDEVAKKAHVKDEIDVLRHGDHDISPLRARETLRQLLISSARNDVPAENCYFQQLGDEPY